MVAAALDDLGLRFSKRDRVFCRSNPVLKMNVPLTTALLRSQAS